MTRRKKWNGKNIGLPELVAKHAYLQAREAGCSNAAAQVLAYLASKLRVVGRRGVQRPAVQPDSPSPDHDDGRQARVH
jgi:hypothetical protein